MAGRSAPGTPEEPLPKEEADEEEEDMVGHGASLFAASLACATSHAAAKGSDVKYFHSASLHGAASAVMRFSAGTLGASLSSSVTSSSRHMLVY